MNTEQGAPSGQTQLRARAHSSVRGTWAGFQPPLAPLPAALVQGLTHTAGRGGHARSLSSHLPVFLTKCYPQVLTTPGLPMWCSPALGQQPYKHQDLLSAPPQSRGSPSTSLQASPPRPFSVEVIAPLARNSSSLLSVLSRGESHSGPQRRGFLSPVFSSCSV